jgi:signal transduction histidine kinase
MQQTGIRVHFTTFAGVEALDGTRRTVLYRVVQEALTNVARHAKAKRVDVSIRGFSKGVRLEVKDDGKSFVAERALHARQSKRLGLLGMKERVEMVGGDFTIESARGQGTTIRAQIPFGKDSRTKTHA